MKNLIKKVLYNYILEERIVWTQEMLKDITSKYNNLTDFIKNEKKAVSALRHKGLFDEMTKHMSRGQRLPYTDDEIEQEARKYSNQADFAKGSPKYYNAYKSRKLQNKFRSFLPLKINRYTDDELRDIALKYQTLNDFLKNEPSASNLARQRDIFDEITQHMPRTKIWTYEEAEQEAKKYKDLNDFTKNSPAFYQSKRNGWLEDFKKFLPLRNIYWTKESVHQEALKYKTKVEFKKNSPKAYSAASSHSWMDDIDDHFERIGNKFNRLIYAFEFPDNSAYIGLTFNEKRRKEDHLNLEKAKSMVARHIIKTGLTPVYKTLTEYMSQEEAANTEACIIEKYKQDGWTILNKNKAGGLGACKRTDLTMEIIRDLASKYPTRVAFKKAHKNEYQMAQKYGWLRDVVAQIPKQDRTKWTYDAVKELAKGVKTRSELKYLNQSAYQQARVNGWLDELFPNTYEYQQKLKSGVISKKK